MSTDDWIATIFMLLALAGFFFKNKKEDQSPKREKPPKAPLVKSDDPWSDFRQTLKIEKDKAIAKQKNFQKPKPKKQEEFVPIVIQRKSLPEHRDVFVSQPARIRGVVSSLPNLRTFMLCREILDKPKGLQ